MQKFVWPMQRLLDVKGKLENALKAELMTLSEQCAALRSRIMMEKIMLRNLLNELADLPPEQRMLRQPEFMQYVHVKDNVLKLLADRLQDVERKRQQKMQELLSLRKFRKGLERLRERALLEYRRQLQQLEQKVSDENTCTVLARQMAATRHN